MLMLSYELSQIIGLEITVFVLFIDVSRARLKNRAVSLSRNGIFLSGESKRVVTSTRNSQ